MMADRNSIPMLGIDSIDSMRASSQDIQDQNRAMEENQMRYERKCVCSCACVNCCGIFDFVCWKLLSYLGMFVFAVLDIGMDWYLYHELSGIKEGLVYGPIIAPKLKAQLAFSVIGTVLALIEIVMYVILFSACIYEVCQCSTRCPQNVCKHVYRKCCTDKPCSCCGASVKFCRMYEIHVNLIRSVVHKMPRLVIQYKILECRDHGLGMIFFIVSILEWLVVLKWFYNMYKVCKSIYQAEKTCNALMQHSLATFFYTINQLAIIGLSIAVFMYIFFRRDSNGDILFSQPRNFISRSYDLNRYFDNVSIFFLHPKLDDHLQFNPNQLDFIRISSFFNDFICPHDYTLKKCSDKELVFEITYSEKDKDLAYFEISKVGIDSPKCYKVDRLQSKLDTSCTLSDIAVYFKFKFYIKLKYHAPSSYGIFDMKEKAFGDLTFNWKIKRANQNCMQLPSSLIISNGYENGFKDNQSVLQYFKIKPNVKSELHVVTENDGIRFFNPNTDLLDIRSVWRPGYDQCESTGNVAPMLDTQLQIDC